MGGISRVEVQNVKQFQDERNFKDGSSGCKSSRMRESFRIEVQS
jgi:hypothetical protein